ncbi:MAG: Plug domain-containing protein [Candidatus Marithrix sp.]
MKAKISLLLTVLYFPVLLFAQKDTSSIILNEVIISTERLEQNILKIPASITVLNKSSIKNEALSSIDDVLKNTMGINIFRPLGMYGQSKVSMRGLGGNEQGRVLVLQDGVPINSSDLGGVNWNRISPLSVSKIGSDDFSYTVADEENTIFFTSYKSITSSKDNVLLMLF